MSLSLEYNCGILGVGVFIMALGVFGSGPYGEIRQIRTEIEACKYELRLKSEGMRRRGTKKGLTQAIETYRARIRKILATEKRRKK